MSKRLLLLNVLLVSGAAVFSVQLGRTFLAAPALPPPRRPPPPRARRRPPPRGGGAPDRRTRARFRPPRRLRRCRQQEPLQSEPLRSRDGLRRPDLQAVSLRDRAEGRRARGVSGRSGDQEGDELYDW